MDIVSQNEEIKLLDKYLKGDCSEKERQKVEIWLEDMNKDKSEWMDMAEEAKQKYIRTLYQDLQKRIVEKPNRKVPIRRRLIYWAAAAVLLLAVTYGLLHVDVSKSEKTIESQSFVSNRTGIGEMKEVILKDGTQVWLNSMSELRYPANFNGDTREVYIIGEAFFEVAKDEKKPFIVHSGVLNTKVLGTSFNVSAYPEEDIGITVISGKVAVEEEAVKDSKAIELEKNETVNFINKSVVLTKDKVANAPDLIAWRHGEMVFYHTPMIEVARVMHRKYGLSIQFKDPKIRHCEISGRFDQKQKLKSVLQAICLSIGGHYSIQGNQVTINGLGYD